MSQTFATSQVCVTRGQPQLEQKTYEMCRTLPGALIVNKYIISIVVNDNCFFQIAVNTQLKQFIVESFPHVFCLKK